MTLSFGNMTVNLNIFNVIKGMGDEEYVCEVNMVDSVVQKYLDNVSHDDPLMSCLVSPSWDEEVTTLESEFLHSIIEHNEVLEVNGWAPKFVQGFMSGKQIWITEDDGNRLVKFREVQQCWKSTSG